MAGSSPVSLARADIAHYFTHKRDHLGPFFDMMERPPEHPMQHIEPIILASSSIRRQDLLSLLGLPFVVHRPLCKETIQKHLSVQENAEYLARIKAESVAESVLPVEYRFVLGADTLLEVDGRAIGKPKTRQEAGKFLKLISGRSHMVISALHLIDRKKSICDSIVHNNKVYFKSLTNKEIKAYLDTNEWLGVAGGYRIQGLAACFIQRIEGSFSSIVGLPIHSLYGILISNGYPFWENHSP